MSLTSRPRQTTDTAVATGASLPVDVALAQRPSLTQPLHFSVLRPHMRGIIITIGRRSVHARLCFENVLNAVAPGRKSGRVQSAHCVRRFTCPDIALNARIGVTE